MTNQEFMTNLREAVEEYFRAVDAWEAAYQKYYRLPDRARQITPDLEGVQSAYLAGRKRLEALVPRARRLGFQYGIRDPWTVLLRTTLGEYAPQERRGSAISRSERAQVNQCLVDLAAACEGYAPDDPEDMRRSWRRRIIDFFY